MLLLDSLDLYCERTDIGILAEPFNAITNMAFLVAAAYLHLLYRDRYYKDKQAWNLIVLVAAIGFGSGIFHIFANRFTMFLDVIPIGMFVFYYLWVVMQRFLHFNRLKVFFLILCFAASAWLMQLIPTPYNLNNSAVYLPCLAAIIYLGLRMKAIKHDSAETFFIAATWFAVSLFFRIIDIALCDITFIGTHFIWHMCNSFVLVLLTRLVIEHPLLTLRNN